MLFLHGIKERRRRTAPVKGRGFFNVCGREKEEKRRVCPSEDRPGVFYFDGPNEKRPSKAPPQTITVRGGAASPDDKGAGEFARRSLTDREQCDEKVLSRSLKPALSGHIVGMTDPDFVHKRDGYFLTGMMI